MSKRAVLGAFSLAVVSSFSISALAGPGPCELKNSVKKNRSVLVASYNNDQVAQLLADLTSECDLTKKFTRLGQRIDLNSTQLYKAMRFVKRDFYENAKAQNLPVSKIYQTTRAAIGLPATEKSDIIWRNFEMGYSQFSNELAQFNVQLGFTNDSLKRIHRNFYQLSKEVGDFSHEPHPGLFYFEAIPNESLAAWWTIKQDELAKTSAQVAEINQVALNLGFLNNLSSFNGIPVHLVRLEGLGFYRTNSRQHAILLENWHRFVRSQISFIGSNYLSNTSGVRMPLMSPLRFALVAQKFFVSIHPFVEGNGRTSRMIQDILLAHFGMPNAPSGDLLSDDTSLTFTQYHSLGVEKFNSFLRQLQRCASSQSSYDCRRL